MTPAERICPVIDQRQVAPGIFLIEIEAPRIAAAAVPGQFAMLGCGRGYDPFLRRPLSLHRVERKGGRVFFLYQIRGKGTGLLSSLHSGDCLPVLGPLGHGFTVEGKAGRALLVGGGIGVAPLRFLAQELAKEGWDLRILIGARTAGVLLDDAFNPYGEVVVCTDDGSLGRRGSVLDPAAEQLKSGHWERVYCCGPLPVLRGIRQMTRTDHHLVQISLEERMACGVGACLGCSCRSSGGQYLRVCRDGPVFDAGQVDLD